MSNSWIERLRDAVLDSSAMRDGLNDDEAQPLVDWGLALADIAGAAFAQHIMEDQETAFDELRGTLLKLLTRITWTALHRQNKGYEWTARTLEQINDFNRRIQGDQAQVLPSGLIQAYAQSLDGLDRGSLVRDIIQRLSAPSSTPSEENPF